MTLDILESHEILTEKLEIYLNKYFDLDKRINTFRNQRFYSLEIELTNRCNRECCYCYNSSCSTSHYPDLPFEVVQKILRESWEHGIKSIAWLGGEPILYPYINEALDYSKSFGFKNVLFTNGSLLSHKRWNKIASMVDKIMLHLDTIDEENYADLNMLTSVESKILCVQTLKNIENILDSGFNPDKIFTYIVLSLPTFKTLEQTLSWIINEKELGPTVLYPMVQAGRAKNVNSNTSLNVRQIQNAFELRAQFEGRPELLLLGPSEYCKHYQLTMAYIRVNGQVTPYAGMPGGYGNIMEESLCEILQKSYQDISFASLVNNNGTNKLRGACGVCTKSIFCFGTRTSAFNITGAENLSDPFCWKGYG